MASDPLGILPSQLTLADAKRKIARVVQGETQDSTLQDAEDALKDALSWWNRRDWKTLLDSVDYSVTADSVEAGRAFYPLPAHFKKVYSVRFGTEPLYYASLRDYDYIIDDHTSLGQPTHYTLFHSGTQGTIRLLSPPSEGAATLSMRFYSAVPMPADDADLLRIPETWEGPILDYARAILAGTRSATESRANRFMGLALQGRKECIADDLYQTDEMQGTRPAPSGARIGSTQWYIRGHYGR